MAGQVSFSFSASIKSFAKERYTSVFDKPVAGESQGPPRSQEELLKLAKQPRP